MSFSGLATASTKKRRSTRRRSDVHLPPSYKTSLLCPTLSLYPSLFTSLSYLLNGRQHIGHVWPMRPQQNTNTCLTWDDRSHVGYIGRRRLITARMLTHQCTSLTQTEYWDVMVSETYCAVQPMRIERQEQSRQLKKNK